MDDDTILGLLAGSRLDALIHAAGGVEHSGLELIDHLERVQVLATQALFLERGSGYQLRSGDEVELRATVSVVMAADWHLHNLLWWTRTLIDRLEHKTRVKGGGHQENGLLIFLASQDRMAVQEAMRLMRDRWKPDVTTLTNYSLHFESVLLEPKRLRWVASRWLLPLATRHAGPIEPFANLHYDRDCESFGRALLKDLREFVDEVLGIFERRQAQRTDHVGSNSG